MTLHYSGVDAATGVEFDASWKGGKPFTFSVGSGQVIKGWDEGLIGMKVGGHRRLVIPSALAYGPSGRPPVITPNEALVFEIDLLSIA